MTVSQGNLITNTSAGTYEEETPALYRGVQHVLVCNVPDKWKFEKNDTESWGHLP